MYASSTNETQIQHKMHFHKTVQDLPIYNIHKTFEALDASKLSVEDIINTVFFNCEDKKHAQICAQTYICHRIISKARELKLTAIFYQDPYERSKTLYEEPTYILVKNRIAGIAKNILSRPIILLLGRCSDLSKKRKIKVKAPKQKRRKTSRSSTFDESLRSIVGKFPKLIIPKLSSKEIEYHMKTKYRVLENKRLSLLNVKKDMTLKKTKHVNKKENLLQNAKDRRSSRLSTKKGKKSLVEKNFQNNFSIETETNFQENYQQVKTKFQTEDDLFPTAETYLKEDCSDTETYFKVNNALGETESYKDDMTLKIHDQFDQLAEKHLSVDDKCLTIAETNVQEDKDYAKFHLQIPENLENFHDEVVDNEIDNMIDDENSCIYDEQNFQENNNACEITATEYLNEDTESIDNQIESMVNSEQKKCYERGYTSTVHLRGDYTFELVVKTQMDVAEDTCEDLKEEFGLDKDVIDSLRELYKSVHEGKNNYIFCELSY